MKLAEAAISIPFVGWAKRSVPTDTRLDEDGGHGADAPLPTLRSAASTLGSPRPACGERSDCEAIRVRGTIRESECVETPPRPDPLPASGGREKWVRRFNLNASRFSCFSPTKACGYGSPLSRGRPWGGIA